MADLRSTSTVGGNIIWHAGNLQFDIEDSSIYFDGFKMYTENDKPTAAEIDVYTTEEADAAFAPIDSDGYLSLSGGTMIGLLNADDNLSITNSNPTITMDNSTDTQSFSLQTSGTQFIIKDETGSEDMIVIDPSNDYVSITQPIFKVDSLTIFNASDTSSLELDPNGSFTETHINNILNVDSHLEVDDGSVLNVTSSAFTYNGSEVFNATSYTTLDARYILSETSTTQYMLLSNSTSGGVLKLNGDDEVSSDDSASYSTIRAVDTDLSLNPVADASLLLNYYAGSYVKFGDGDGSTVAYVGSDGLFYQGEPDGTSYQYWNESNMGADSGLNADLLDGQEGSYYLTGSNITTASESAQGTIFIASESEAIAGTNDTAAMTPLRVEQYCAQFGVTESTSITSDWDTIKRGFIIRNGSSNIPDDFTSGVGYDGISVFNSDASAGAELLISNQDGNEIYVRTYIDSAWSDPIKVLTSGDMGSGSGIDADTLDGEDGSFYQNASNINSGTISDSYLPATITSNISGNAATATKLATARTIAVTGAVTGSASFNGTANASIATTIQETDELDSIIFEATYPIGSVYTNYSNSSNPSTYLAGGSSSSWTAIAGRVVVGVGTADSTEFSAKSTGGSATVTLTTSQMPAHTHTGSTASAGGHTHTITSSSASSGAHTHSTTGTAASAGSHTHTASGTAASAGAHTHDTTGTAASAGAHTHTFTGVHSNSYSSSNYYPMVGGSGSTHTNSVNSAGAHTHDVTGTAASAGAHTHTVTVSVTSAGAHTHSVSGTAASAGAHTHTITSSSATAGAHTHTVSVTSTGGGGSHTNLQPYITCYVWRRTA